MIFLTGHSGDAIRAHAHHPRLGLMMQPGNGYASQIDSFGIFGADNACFAKGDAFDADVWLAWLDELPRAGCLFAVAPDVVGDAAATWARSAPYLDVIRSMGFPAALVSQDGLVAPDWDAFDCLFTGGTTEWKLSEDAYALVAEANRRGKWTHMGRVNSWPRLKAAAAAGYDSADGTFLAFGPDVNTPKLLAWLDRLDLHPFIGVGA